MSALDSSSLYFLLLLCLHFTWMGLPMKIYVLKYFDHMMCHIHQLNLGYETWILLRLPQGSRHPCREGTVWELRCRDQRNVRQSITLCCHTYVMWRQQNIFLRVHFDIFFFVLMGGEQPLNSFIFSSPWGGIGSCFFFWLRVSIQTADPLPFWVGGFWTHHISKSCLGAVSLLCLVPPSLEIEVIEMSHQRGKGI